jgi:hypothetical protein
MNRALILKSVVLFAATCLMQMTLMMVRHRTEVLRGRNAIQ